MERVKRWVPDITSSATSMLDKWETLGGNRSEFEIDVHKEFHTFSADVISRVAFGSSYEEGKRIFQLQEEQLPLILLAIRSPYIPGFRFLPTKANLKRRSIDQDIRNSIRKLIEMNRVRCEESKNLVGLMLAANKTDNEKMGIEEIIDECKTFYFAGKETTANVLTWTILLLANNKEWQQKARDEVIEVCGKHEPPKADNVGSLKVVNMVLKESTRLYTTAVFLNRVTTRDIKLGKYDIPKGTHVQMPVIDLHRDAELWGANAKEFDPSRFADDKKYHPGAYIPFGLGPAFCVGQNLAMIELKVALSVLLQRFAIEVSTSYVHAPMIVMTTTPQYGAQVLVRKI